MEPTAVHFARTARSLADAARARGLDPPTFRSPPRVPGVTRTYDSGRRLRADVVDARVWLGIHFRFADTAADDMGVRVATWALARNFRPT